MSLTTAPVMLYSLRPDDPELHGCLPRVGVGHEAANLRIRNSLEFLVSWLARTDAS